MIDRMNTIDPQWAWQPFSPSTERLWNRGMVAHLYRRTGFGASIEQLDEAVSREPAQVVDQLIGQNVETSDFKETADTLAQTILASGDAQKLAAAWVYRLLLTPTQLLEKATLFWHGHFATSAEKVNDASMMWDQNRLLREHALGSFPELVQSISKDPAMLIYLDSAINRKAQPNENFARELMELFCLGEGNYSEHDVQQLARCFTGWEVKNKRFRKNRYQHDNGSKSILGTSGDYDGEDGVNVVLKQPQVELFLARKWFRFFISDDLVPNDNLLRPLASAFRDHGLQVAPVLRMMFSSNLFFTACNVSQDQVACGACRGNPSQPERYNQYGTDCQRIVATGPRLVLPAQRERLGRRANMDQCFNIAWEIKLDRKNLDRRCNSVRRPELDGLSGESWCQDGGPGD